MRNILIVLTFLGIATTLTALDFNSLPDASLFDYRYGMTDTSDLQKLRKQGKLLGSSNRVFYDKEAKEYRMAGYGEFHAVYDASIQDIITVILDFESYKKFVPFILSGTTLASYNDRQTTRFKTGISFLGIQITLETISENRVDYLENSCIGIRSRLLESPGGAMFEHFLSWYLEPVYIDQKRMTYIRYYNRPGLRRPLPGTDLIANTFAHGNIQGQIDSIIKETKKRALVQARQ